MRIDLGIAFEGGPLDGVSMCVGWTIVGNPTARSAPRAGGDAFLSWTREFGVAAFDAEAYENDERPGRYYQATGKRHPLGGDGFDYLIFRWIGDWP